MTTRNFKKVIFRKIKTHLVEFCPLHIKSYYIVVALLVWNIEEKIPVAAG